MSPRILVLDDNPTNLDVIRATLEPNGYEVLTTTDLKQALQLVETSRPDVILSDLYLPDASGFEFLMKMKEDKVLPRIPFIVITSQSWNSADRASALALGADKFIKRPIEPGKLLREIAEALGS